MPIPKDPEKLIKELRVELKDWEFRFGQVEKRNLFLEERHKITIGRMVALKNGRDIDVDAAEIDKVIRGEPEKAQELDIF